MKLTKEYCIPFVGLKLGKHVFEFEIKDKFFEAFDYSEIQKGNLHLTVEVDKQSTMLVLDFHLNGSIHVACDRCNDELEQQLFSDNRLVVKLGEETGSTDFDIVVLGPDESEVDLSQFIYEFAHLALPAKRVHPRIEDCNQDVLAAMSQYLVESDSSEIEGDEDLFDIDNQEEE